MLLGREISLSGCKLQNRLITDALGWVDDFRASPGECGSLLSRKLYIHGLLLGGTSIRALRKMGFKREHVEEVILSVLEQEYK